MLSVDELTHIELHGSQCIALVVEVLLVGIVEVLHKLVRIMVLLGAGCVMSGIFECSPNAFFIDVFRIDDLIHFDVVTMDPVDMLDMAHFNLGIFVGPSISMSAPFINVSLLQSTRAVLLVLSLVIAGMVGGHFELDVTRHEQVRESVRRVPHRDDHFTHPLCAQHRRKMVTRIQHPRIHSK